MTGLAVSGVSARATRCEILQPADASGWEKALGDFAELDWWQDRVTGAAGRCGVGATR